MPVISFFYSEIIYMKQGFLFTEIHCLNKCIFIEFTAIFTDLLYISRIVVKYLNNYTNVQTKFCALVLQQRIQYAKSKSDAIAKLQGTYVPREKRPREKKTEEPSMFILLFCLHKSIKLK